MDPPKSSRLTKTSKRRLRFLHVCLTATVIWNMVVIYKYFVEPFVQDPFLRRWEFFKYWITNEPLVFLFSLVFVSLNVCLYICTGFMLISILDMENGITNKSLRRVKILRLMLLLGLLFNMFVVYKYYFEQMLEDPVFRSQYYFKFRFRKEPFWVSFSILSVYMIACIYICCGFILISPIVRMVWGVLKTYLPCRIRRRTWCFCNCSCKSLERILKGIYNSHCDWEPQRPEVLDATTKRYVTSILNGCKDKLNIENMNYRLVGSSAEGLGKPYTLELNKGYLDPLGKFLLRFFCCCCPCSTAYTSLRTDFDIIMECDSSNTNINHNFKLEDLEKESDSPGFVRLQYEEKKEGNPLALLCKKVNGHYYLSSSTIRSNISDIVNDSSENELPASRIFGVFKHPPVIELEETGPAVKLVTYPLGQAWYWNDDQKVVSFEGDIVFGIHYFQAWPSCASHWSRRPRLWPSANVVTEIVQSGFILVPKPSHNRTDQDDEIEWHISFPHCETFLSTKIPKVAKACYLALKLILKNHLVYHCDDLKTYYLKTMLLWELEKHAEEFWSLENIVECFDCLLDSLIKCVNQKKCPNYWIESLDLFEKVDRKALSSLTRVLTKIQSNPAPYIEDIGSMWC